jgi:uncharacterized protein
MENIVRILQNTLESQIGRNKVLLLFGTRRVGKTKLLEAIQRGREDYSLMMNGEDLGIQELLAQRTKANYERLIGSNTLIMIDEAQSIPDIGRHLKFMIDNFSQITIIATGSSSFDLMNQSGEPLTGRSFQYTLYPLSQKELISHYGYVPAQQMLGERLVYGNYPEVLQLDTIGDKQQYLRSLVHTYLLKDIFIYETVKNSGKIFDLLRLIAYQAGNEVSMDELSRKLQMSKNTVERYLDLLTKVFVLFRVGGFSSNLRKEVTKSSKWYFFDNGIRNAIISDFRELPLRTDVGQLWENFCFYERIKHQHYTGKHTEYYFWRTYDQQEIDMIEQEQTAIRAFEFKWSDEKHRVPKYFSLNYPEASFEVITPENAADFFI